MLRTKPIRNILTNPLIAPFYLPSLIFSFAQGLLLPILPLYVADFDVSYGLVGVVLAGAGLGALLGDIPAGMLLGRFGKKRVMLLGLGCAGLSMAAIYWASSMPQVFLLRLLTGLGTASYGVARHAFVADNIAVASRGRSVALLGGLFRLGSFAGPAIGGSVAAAFGLRAPFLLSGAAAATALIAVAIFVPANDKTSAKSHGARQHGGTLFATLKAHYRVLATAGAGQFFAQMIRGGRRVIIPLYGADVIGLDAQAIGFIISVSAAVDMALFYPTGMIMDQIGRKFAIVPSFTLQAIGMALVPLTGSFEGLLIAASVIGLGNGLGSGTMMTLGADLAPADSRGEFLGVWRLIGDGGDMSGPLVTGAVADLVGLSAAALALSAAGLTAAAIFAFLVPETLRKRAPPVGVT
jgi:MFS family permease